jgi:hypothetical protein
VSANEHYRLFIWGDQLNNSGSPVTYTWRFKVGATTVLASPGASRVTNANTRRWVTEIDFYIISTTSQQTVGKHLTSAADSGTFSIQGEANVGTTSSTEDFATAKNLVWSIQMGTANANAQVRLLGYQLEKVAE